MLILLNKYMRFLRENLATKFIGHALLRKFKILCNKCV